MTIVVSDGPGGLLCGTWSTSISSVVSGGTPQTVTAYWSGGGESGSSTLRFLRGAWRGRLTGMPGGPPISVYVEAVTSDSGTGRSATRSSPTTLPTTPAPADPG